MSITPRTSRLLDVMAALAMAGPIFIVAYTALLRPIPVTLTLAGFVVLALLTWWRWRRTAGAGSALGFAAAAIGILIAGDGPLTFGGIWLATLILTRTFASAIALGYLVLVCGVVAGLHLGVGSPPATVLMEMLSTAALAGLGLGFALVLAESEERAVELAEVNGRLTRRLGHEQDLAVTQERARTARDLHDGLGHRLTAAGLSLEYVERTRRTDPQGSAAELSHARTVIAEALTEMRTVVRAMHPVDLTAAPGRGAYTAIADSFSSAGLDVRVDLDIDDELPVDFSTLLVRFTQEGLTNVVRHSRAVSAHLGITDDAGAGQLRAVLEDFGARAAPEFVEGFGLRSLRERAAALGGHLRAGTTATGFRVELTLPRPHLEGKP